MSPVTSETLMSSMMRVLQGLMSQLERMATQVTPETETKVKDLMEGDDVTQQWCTDCCFKGTKKRVKIRCMQHYCKYMCECMLVQKLNELFFMRYGVKHAITAVTNTDSVLFILFY